MSEKKKDKLIPETKVENFIRKKANKNFTGL